MAARNKGYRPSKTRLDMTPGDMVKTVRELQDLSQLDLAKAADIPQPTLSAIENGRVALGVERAERLARALRVHPAVLLWPNWDIEREARRAG
jgi:transcriptional regulator with XRE-family HTH domain